MQVRLVAAPWQWSITFLILVFKCHQYKKMSCSFLSTLRKLTSAHPCLYSHAITYILSGSFIYTLKHFQEFHIKDPHPMDFMNFSFNIYILNDYYVPHLLLPYWVNIIVRWYIWIYDRELIRILEYSLNLLSLVGNNPTQNLNWAYLSFASLKADKRKQRS